jgi:hypothetical protein
MLKNLWTIFRSEWSDEISSHRIGGHSVEQPCVFITKKHPSGSVSLFLVYRFLASRSLARYYLTNLLKLLSRLLRNLCSSRPSKIARTKWELLIRFPNLESPLLQWLRPALTCLNLALTVFAALAKKGAVSQCSYTTDMKSGKSIQ